MKMPKKIENIEELSRSVWCNISALMLMFPVFTLYFYLFENFYIKESVLRGALGAILFQYFMFGLYGWMTFVSPWLRKRRK